MTNLLDKLYCWLNGHTPITSHTFSRIKATGNTQYAHRYQCFVCGKRMK